MVMTQYYHTRDPIENLRVLVTLRKISGAEGVAEGNNNHEEKAREVAVPIGTTWTHCFRWQEWWPPSTSLRIDHVKEISRDQDNREVLMSFSGSETSVPPPARWVGDSASLVSGTLGSRNRERVRRQILREEGVAVREMHIGARIEGNEEVLLMTLRYNVHSGLLYSTPGFSIPIGNFESDPDRALKGAMLSTYQFISASGARYEVALDNASDLQPIESVEHERAARELMLRERMDDVEAVEQWQKQQHKAAPPRSLVGHRTKCGIEKQLSISCEIVSVKNSRSKDPIGVEYVLVAKHSRRRGRVQWRVMEDSNPIPSTPRGKKLGSHSSQPRRSPLCVPRRAFASERGASIAAFGCHTVFHVQQIIRKSDSNQSSAAENEDGSGEECLNRLNLKFGVYSRDSWGRKRREAVGQLQMPASPGFHDCEIPLVKPVMSIREHLEEQFLGMEESEVWQYPTPAAGQPSDDGMWGGVFESTDMTLRVRLNMVVSSAASRSAAHLNESTTRVVEDLASFEPQATPGSRVIKRSVQEILQSVRLERRLGGALYSIVGRAMELKESADHEQSSFV